MFGFSCWSSLKTPLTVKTFLKGLLDVLGCFFKFLPSKKKYILFSQANSRYCGNSKFLYQYLFDSDWKVYWICASSSQLEKIPARYRKRAVYRKTLKSLYLHLFCKAVVISHGLSDFGVFSSLVKHKLVLNVWHGSGIKGVMLLDHSINIKEGDHYIKRESSYYDAVTVASDIFRYIFCASHLVDARKIHVTGDARIDLYLSSRRSFLQARTGEFNILYAPTFRGKKTKFPIFFPFEDFNVEDFQNYLEEKPDIIFYLRPHPNDIQSSSQVKTLAEVFPGRVVDLSSDKLDDIDSILHIFDLVISDYSSIHFEPLLADVPCLFVSFDYEEYLTERGFVLDYDLVAPGPKVLNFQEMVAGINAARFGMEAWSTQREQTRKLFFRYSDEKSCERVESVLRSLVN
ncbi:CDP-glycerol glycerophosphotransferase family protein [Marinobacter sp. CA1]|uniref:CDP-glycerol glycerophosphotransferase family protein n=1 Tax=Marinobacter sp. CA1 TaxID=2817656 RepID=UPI001D0935E9|nr:CDP-glycerol glycerophosphotransferase family protein [Marinobacter sp. CA1]UDL03850.1 CDP-glycerol glycerophosphotransferase family protein [Marinobacter sp. CA1]